MEATLRPVRPAALIPDDDPGMAAKFAVSRCVAWGGHASYVIPYSRSGGVSEAWRELLELLDPDELFALGPLQEAVKDSLNDAGRLVYPRDEPASLFVHASTLLHSVLGAVGQDLKPPDSERFVIVPKISRGALGYLPLLARYGDLDEKDVKDALERRHSRYRFDLDLSRFVRVEEIDATRAPLDLWAGDLRSLVREEEAEHALTLPYLTRTTGLRITGSLSLDRVAGTRVRDAEAEHHSPVVVTGAGASVEDFALYWNLRAEHFFADPFPLWMPLGMLEQPEAPEVIQRALGRIWPGAGTAAPRTSDLKIVSASTSTAELRERLRDGYPEARIGAESFAELFARTCEYRYTTEKIPAYFDRGRASIQPPRPGEFESNLTAGVDHVAYEVGVDGVWIAQSETMAWHLGWMRFRSRDNVSKRGNLRFVEQFDKEFSERELLDLRTPDGWSVLSSVFEERGYNIAPTAKSEAALGQLALLGGIENLKVAASSKVRELLRELCRRQGEKRSVVGDRKTMQFERFQQKWGKDAGRDLLRWLVERRVLFRGAVLKCPKCQLCRWYEVDRIGDLAVRRLPGELTHTPRPPQDRLAVPRQRTLCTRPRPGDAYAPADAERYAHRLGPLADLGFYPGIEIKAKNGAAVPFPKKEIDLVVMRGGSLILAECKESTKHLAQEGEAAEFARQFGELVKLADHLGASLLLGASSTTFPENESLLLREIPAGHSVEIGWLDGYDLLNPNLFSLSLYHPKPRGEHTDKPEGWKTDYLDWVRRSVADLTV